MRAYQLCLAGAISLGVAACSSQICSNLAGTNFNTKAAPCASGTTFEVTETIPSASTCDTEIKSCNTGDETLLTTYSGCLAALSTCSPGGTSEETFVSALEACNDGISGLTASCASAFGFSFIHSSTASSGSSSGSTGSSSSSSSSSGVVSGNLCASLSGSNFDTKVAPCTGSQAVVVTENLPAEGTCVTDLGSCSTGDQALLLPYAACLSQLEGCSPGEGTTTFEVELDACNDMISGLSATCASAFGLHLGGSSSGSTGGTSGSTTGGSSSGASGSSSGSSSGATGSTSSSSGHT